MSIHKNPPTMTMRSESAAKFIKNITGCAFRLINRFPRARKEPSRNIRKIWRKLIEIIRTPSTADKSLITEESYGAGCRDDSGSRPTFRRPLCWMTVISRAMRFMRRMLSMKRAAAVRCRILKTNLRMRLSTIPSLENPGLLLHDESPPEEIINDHKEQQCNQERWPFGMTKFLKFSFEVCLACVSYWTTSMTMRYSCRAISRALVPGR